MWLTHSCRLSVAHSQLQVSAAHSQLQVSVAHSQLQVSAAHSQLQVWIRKVAVWVWKKQPYTPTTIYSRQSSGYPRIHVVKPLQSPSPQIPDKDRVPFLMSTHCRSLAQCDTSPGQKLKVAGSSMQLQTHFCHSRCINKHCSDCQ